MIMLLLLLCGCGRSDNVLHSPIKKMPQLYAAPQPDVHYEQIVHKALPSKEMLQEINVNVMDDTSLREFLRDISQDSGVNINLKENVHVTISAFFKTCKLIELIKEICELYDLNYEIMGSSIKIEKHVPYQKTYFLPFLNIVRESAMNTDIAVSNVQDKIAMLSEKSKAQEVWSDIEGFLHTLVSVDKAMNFSINKHTGVVSVIASKKQHQEIEQYFDYIKSAIYGQVLIEAKIVEVYLNKESSYGINWNLFKSPSYSIKDGVKNIISSLSLDVMIDMLKEFGELRVLSNPSILTTHNQPAILKAHRDEIGFEQVPYRERIPDHLLRQRKNVITHEMYQPSQLVYTRPKTYKVGLSIIVHPIINPITKKIILAIKPSIARLKGHTKYGGKNGPQIPIIEQREISSVIQIQSGSTIMIGGLMIEEQTNQTGWSLKNILFSGNKAVKSVKSEMIIMIKATIIR